MSRAVGSGARSIHTPTRTTPFPNFLLDEAMPHLKDTEWRLLCVIVRQTMGWKGGSGANNRKRRDWLTREQLKARTGRDSEALAKAVDALMKMNYLVAENEEGRPLSTPDERRRNRAKVYYCLARRSLIGRQLPTIEHDTRAECSLMPGIDRPSELEKVGKANITKEKPTKEIVTKKNSSLLLNRTQESHVWDSHIQGSSTQEGSTPGDSGLEIVARQVFQEELNPLGREAGIESGQQVQLLEELFSGEAEAFTALFIGTAKRLGKPVNIQLSPRDRPRLEKLLEKHKGLDWMPFLELFFRCDLGHVTRQNHSLRSFLDTCNIFLTRIPGAFHYTNDPSRRSGWRKPFH
jgi:hypothetical protein